jgi:hypothetical protein
MAESVVKSYFPSQVASDLEKMSEDYGLKVAKAIEGEWFKPNGVSQTAIIRKRRAKYTKI